MRKLVPAATHGVAGRFGTVLRGADDIGYSNQFEPHDTAIVSHIGGRGPGVAVVVDQCLTAYAAGDHNALFDLGVVFSTGSNGAPRDLVEAHKWFNIAAAAGHEEAAISRSEIAEEMSSREIGEAQRRARAHMATMMKRAA
ncbi:hypothetical protein [uncultured Croceicoccus sp.]|uniref:hypothetical protein n=1 Tax=uncultured Croceicoccus sp. TaxID=1295329 RepID=UPI00344EAF21